jgi:cell division protease FtsH
MVCEYGMSAKMGSITLGRKDEMVFIGRDMMKEKNYSEQTAKMIDAEVKKIVEDCHKKALEILRKNKKYLKAMAEALLEREVLDGEDVDNILAGKKMGPKPAAKYPPAPSNPSSSAPVEAAPKVTLKPQAAPSQAMKPGGQVG